MYKRIVLLILPSWFRRVEILEWRSILFRMSFSSFECLVYTGDLIINKIFGLLVRYIQ